MYLQRVIDDLDAQNTLLDQHEAILQQCLESLVHNTRTQLAYVPYRDLRALPAFSNSIIIGIKAPAGTRLGACQGFLFL